MKRFRSWRWLSALAIVSAVMPATAQDNNRAGPVCAVTLAPRCASAGLAVEPVVDTLSVAEVPAGSEQECVDKARQLVAACQQPSGARSLVRFRQGPVDRVRDLSGAPARRLSGDLSLPIVYGKNFEAEFAQFGYSPDFSPGPMSFDNDGRMLVRSGNFLQVRGKEGGWSFIDLSAAATTAIQKLPDVSAFRWILDTRAANADLDVFVDARNRWYTLVQGMPSRLKDGNALTMRPYLLVSTDQGQTWTAVSLKVPDDRPSWRATIEHNDGNNDRSGPPPVLTFDQSEREAVRQPLLFLWTFKWDGGNLAAMQTKVSDKSILVDNHSGGANSLVSTADRIYVVYPGRTDPKMAGTPAYMVVFDKAKNAVQSETMLAAAGGAASADNHNIPGICLGRDRDALVVLPGHQEDLRVMNGRIAGDGTMSFSAPQAIGERKERSGGYTYATLNCDRSGGVYVVSRWAGDQYRFQLVLLQRTAGGEWGTFGRTRHLVLVDPGRQFYGAWRQKAALDGRGNLFLHYAYYANQLTAPELALLKTRFPFENWRLAKEVTPPQCVAGGERRCWMHPLPEVTNVMLRTDTPVGHWQFVQ